MTGPTAGEDDPYGRKALPPLDRTAFLAAVAETLDEHLLMDRWDGVRVDVDRDVITVAVGPHWFRMTCQQER